MANEEPEVTGNELDPNKRSETNREKWLETVGSGLHEDDVRFTTISGEKVPPLAVPNRADEEYDKRLGYPGQYPFTRGVYPSMYRGRLWTIRQFSGFGSARDTNERYKFLLEKGQTGLSVAFDMPTLMGRDSDDPLGEGEVGRCGVAISSPQDMRNLFDGIPLEKVSTSMTINGPAIVLLGFYIVAAEKQGADTTKLRGTIQNDILKEYIAQKCYVYPPRPALRLITDIMAYCKDHLPKWNTISISGYHIREAGSTAAQELAFTLADGFAYVQAGIEAGMVVDDFAPQLSFFFNAHLDFFEEIAKYRAARRIWARHLKEKYGSKNDRSLLLRFHTQTAGCSLTAQQMENNIVRTAWQALGAVLGGTQSLHTNSMDETHALPTEQAAKVALRTQQLIAHESGVANSIDPLAGSYFVEQMTDRIEQQAEEYFRQIDELGGVVPAIEAGFFQKEIGKAAYQYAREVEKKKRIVVGVNKFVEDEAPDMELLKIGPEVEQEQRERLAALRTSRDGAKADATLAALTEAVTEGRNSMPALLEAVRADATLGEIIGAMKKVFGEYHEPAVF